jgi:hypothetical protein
MVHGSKQENCIFIELYHILEFMSKWLPEKMETSHHEMDVLRIHLFSHLPFYLD